MIKLYRGAAPAFLSGKEVADAKKKLEMSFRDSSRQERMHFDSSLLEKVKDELTTISSNKCAYCETGLGHTSFAQIESFRPRGGARGFDATGGYASMHYFWLAYEWENLLMACEICDTKYKRDYFPVEDEGKRARIGARGEELLMENALLLDPCRDNPEEHLEFLQDGTVRDLSLRGKVTIEIIGLNRQELVNARANAVSQFLRGLEHLNVSSSLAAELAEYVTELFNPSPLHQYAAAQRHAFRVWYKDNATLWEELKETPSYKGMKSDFKKQKQGGTKKERAVVEEHLSAMRRFSIRSVTIENFRSIDKIQLDMLAVNDKNKREPWLLVLGDNGIGKSSILQGIALALMGRQQLEKLNPDVEDYIKKGTKSGSIIIESFERDEPVVLKFDRKGFHTTLEESPTFLLGYGATRLLPRGPIQPDNDKEPYQNIRNLFDYSVSLNDPGKWLASIDTTEFTERVAPAFRDILALKTGERIWLDEGRIMIHQHQEDQALDDNSDGFKTVVGFVSDIMQTLSVDQANYHNSQGIVLIDEIGNHLHPRWRMKIVSGLRKAFPHLQFIVTTHEPLCLRGLSHGEVAVLMRDSENSIRVLDKTLLPDHSLMRIDQLLTSDLFGLISSLDEEEEKTYDDYYTLLRKDKKSEEDKNKITEISALLAEKRSLGTTPQEQIFYKVIEETYVDKLREDGFKTEVQLKKETLKDVKEMLDKKKMDWL